MTTDAYVFDAVRTPRGRGKKDGSLHEVKPIDLLTTLLDELRTRYDLDTAQVDDLILGCVMPVGDQGGNIARTAVLDAGLGVRAVPGSAAQPLLFLRIGGGQPRGHEGALRLG